MTATGTRRIGADPATEVGQSRPRSAEPMGAPEKPILSTAAEEPTPADAAYRRGGVAGSGDRPPQRTSKSRGPSAVAFRPRRGAAGPRRRATETRGPQPRITADHICRRALELVERDGLEALTLRNLAAELRVSTRTLYKRIHNRAALIRVMTDTHLARLDPQCPPSGTWEEMIWSWCGQLHHALVAHPHLTSMTQDRILAAIGSQVNTLIDGVVGRGVPSAAAAECCWSVADLTIHDAATVARSVIAGDPACGRLPSTPSKTSADAIKWILRGVGTQTGSAAIDDNREATL